MMIPETGAMIPTKFAAVGIFETEQKYLHVKLFSVRFNNAKISGGARQYNNKKWNEKKQKPMVLVVAARSYKQNLLKVYSIPNA